MTRMNGFFLHQCPLCGQLHKRGRYASISIYVPMDLSIDENELIRCKSCQCDSKYIDYSIVTTVVFEPPDISWLYGKKPTFLSRLKRLFIKQKKVKYDYPYLI